MNHKFFVEYRAKDYRTPRSVKEAYGWDAPLYVEKTESDLSGWFWLVGIMGLLIWLAYGWV